MTGRTGTKGKILVVDDVRTVREWTRLVLEEAGYKVVTTDNPLLVSALIYQERPEVVLIDLSMSLLGGERIIEIMEDSRYTPILLLYSSKPPEELRDIAGRCKASGFVQKTSNPAILVREVRAYLK